MTIRFVGTALLLAACVAVAPRGGLVAVLLVPLSAIVAAIVTHAFSAEEDRGLLIPIVVLAVLARSLLVGLVDSALLLRSGSLTYAPDEVTYLTAARALSRHWSDPTAPFDATKPYLSSQYVQMMATVFILFGENLVVVKLLNTFMGVMTAVLLYRSMKNMGLRGAPLAAIALLAFPSIAFWSALALKDAFVLFFLIAALWTASEFINSRRWLWLGATGLVLLPIASVRTYIFILEGFALLATVLAVQPWKYRLVTGGAITAMVFALFVLVQPFKELGANPFYIPIFVRNINAAYGQSSFITPPPAVTGKPGDRFEVTVPNQTPDAGSTPRVIVVEPGIELIVVSSASATVQPGQVAVRPGDIVVIAGGTPTPSAGPSQPVAARATIPPVILHPEVRSPVGIATETVEDTTSVGGSLRANIRQLPLGLLYSLFAPFPWSPPRTLEQAAAIPEMIFWYGCLLFGAAATALLIIRRDLRFAFGFATATGLLLILALIESNVGTLLRSRAMLVPYVLALGAAGWVETVATRRRIATVLTHRFRPR
jgi:4-amino-4-deoxy-L-arabinose transferase-like glycosyltransferase